MQYEKSSGKSSISPEGSAVDLPFISHKAYPGDNPQAFRRFVDSFKRDPNAHFTPRGTIGADGRIFDVEAAAQATANSPLHRRLRGRHLQMIAIGGSIGTGLFIGSGDALATGGPASVLISFLLIGVMLYCTVHALGEMAVLFPVSGSFSAFSTRFLDPAWGFAMGWNYAIQWLVVLPLEIVSATITIQFWTAGRISNDAFVSIFLLLIIVINLFGIQGYGESEFVFALIKVIAIVGFILLGIILNCGGGPGGTYIGGKYWHDPGAFRYGFKGLCSVFVSAAFAFGGTELVGLAAAETANPRRSLPTAAKQVFWRISLFYIVSLSLVGLLVPYNDPRLLSDSSPIDTKASPFVIAISDAGIAVLPSVFNVVILVAVLSVGNSAIFGSSRTLAALADQGQAPKILGYIDRQGRPIVAVGVAAVFGLMGFLASSSQAYPALYWMLATSGLSSIFTWGSICLAHIRFRRAWKMQGHTLDELAFTSQAGVAGSWLGLALNGLVLLMQFWTSAWPIGYEHMTGRQMAVSFFQGYMAAPLVLVCYVVYKIARRTEIQRCHNMDLHTGIRDLNVSELVAEERMDRAAWPKWKRVYKLFC